jgi:CO/xanthine dehydrogenase FAD-binding subunit
VTAQEYFLPKSLDEATGLLAEHGPALLVMAGGTLAMPLINQGISTPDKVMGLRHAGLSYVQRTNGMLLIGAATRLTTIANLNNIPLLAKAASYVGGWSIRNMGTVGGNLFAPPPAGDLAVALLALDAKLKLVSQSAERILPLSDFYRGFMITALEPGEIVSEVIVPSPRGKTAFLKHGRKLANTPAVVTVAAHLVMDGSVVTEARLSLSAVGPHPMRARRAEKLLEGSRLDSESIAAASTTAAEECEPFTDAVASEWYRRKMVVVFVRRALEEIAG